MLTCKGCNMTDHDPEQLPDIEAASACLPVDYDGTEYRGASAASNQLAVSPPRYAYSESKSGRKRKTRVYESPPPAKDVKKQKKSKDKVDVESEFDKQWICAECKEAECSLNLDAEQLLLCEGPCRRLFHYPCVNLNSLPAEEEPFYCTDCNNKRHRCAICQDFGQDNLDVFKCKRDDCGFFFHEGCLAVRNIDFTNKEVAKLDGGMSADDHTPVEEGPHVVFECPAHHCWTCASIKLEETTESDMRVTKASKSKSHKSVVTEAKRGELFSCIECPRSYHLTCIPPTARLHELAMLCHEHAATCKLPDLDKETSLQQAIENEVDKKFFEGKKQSVLVRKTLISRNPFFLGFLGEHRTRVESQFIKEATNSSEDARDDVYCLPATIRDDVYSMPPTYRHIQGNKVDQNNAPPRIPLGEPCQCEDACGDDCLNRATYVECANKNCRVGPSCGNRRIAQRKVPKCKVKREQGKGWGLVTLETIHKGDLVQEYIGEIIDEAEKEKRLTEWSRDHPNDTNFYIMANAPGWFIDARLTSNLSRFINHSCAPNCILTTFTVNGVMRNGIYALREIKAGEYLSYDYNFDTRRGDKFTCRCGAATCRGSLKNTGQRKDEIATKTKPQLWEEAKAGYERDKKFIEEYERDEALRRSQVKATVPGSLDELVSNGPQRQKYREEVISSRAFLWRNVELGSNFVTRSIRLMSGASDTEEGDSV